MGKQEPHPGCGETKTCAGSEDMSKKRLSLTRMLRNVGEKRLDHVAIHGAFVCWCYTLCVCLARR